MATAYDLADFSGPTEYSDAPRPSVQSFLLLSFQSPRRQNPPHELPPTQLCAACLSSGRRRHILASRRSFPFRRLGASCPVSSAPGTPTGARRVARSTVATLVRTGRRSRMGTVGASPSTRTTGLARCGARRLERAIGSMVAVAGRRVIAAGRRFGARTSITSRTASGRCSTVRRRRRRAIVDDAGGFAGRRLRRCAASLGP